MKTFVWACAQLSRSAIAVGVAALLGPPGILAVAVLALAPATSQAGIIVWGTPSLIDVTQPTQVLNTGVVYSAAFNNPYTVNSVLFNTAPSTANSDGSGGNTPSIPGANPSYLAIVSSGQFRGFGSNATVTLSGLTSGQTYRLQVFTPFWNADYETKLISGANTVAMGNTGNLPTYVSGLFTASGSTQMFDWTANTNPGYGLLAAVSVSVAAVPEIDPATGGSALSLVAGVLAMIEKRRRRAALVA